VIFLTLAGISTFSSTITEEKEEETLGLLQMAGVDSLGLLLGKSGGRLIQALLLVAVQYPFTLLSITLGGVTILQIQAAYASLLGYLIFGAGAGALCSTICQSSRGSSRAMVFILILYAIIPWFAGEVASELGSQGQNPVLRRALEFVSHLCIFYQTGDILVTSRTDSLISYQAVSNLVLGMICFGLAWAVFGLFSSRPPVNTTSRGMLAVKSHRFSLFSPGRARGNPLVWKDFYFSTAGISGILVRFSAYGAVFGLILWQSGTFEEGWRVFLGCLLFAIPFDCSLLVSRSLQDEVRGMTIPSLIMLPRSVPSIVYSKLAGALIGLFPCLVCFSVAFVASGALDALFHSDWTGVSYSMLMIPSFVLLPHLAAVFAMMLRWGAVPLAIGALYALTIVETSMIGCVFIFLPGSGGIEVALAIMGVMNMALCVACHFEVLRRFHKHSEK
jgi:hypothetical protein